jgi:1,4-dihydroxy-2-naphthoyl-CoA synthase
MPALDTVERDWRAARRGKDYTKDAKVGAGSLVIVGNRKQDKFFSNGKWLGYYKNIYRDIKSVAQGWTMSTLAMTPTSSHLSSTLSCSVCYSSLVCLSSLSHLKLIYNTHVVPTIAALNGHCFAAGFVLAMTCDYRVIMSDAQRRVWMSMNEVHFGAPWPLAFATLFRAKVGDARVHRAVALEGQRITPKHAKDVGLVDEIVGTKTEEVLNKAMDLARQASQGARSGVWGLIKVGRVFTTCVRCSRNDDSMTCTRMFGRQARWMDASSHRKLTMHAHSKHVFETSTYERSGLPPGRCHVT